MILQIIIAVIVSMVLGFIWYGPLFGKVWGRIMGVDMEAAKNDPEVKKRMPLMAATNMALSLVTIFMLAVIFKRLDVTDVTTGVRVAFFLFIGFIFPLIGTFALWSSKPRRLVWEMFFVMMGYQLIMFVFYGIILSL